MSAITIRQAVLTDLAELTQLFDLYRQFQGCASDVAAARAFLLDRFNHGESVIFIAHADGRPVGFTQLYPSFSSVSLARTFTLNDLFVHADARRMGVASKLLDAATDYAKLVGAIRVSLLAAITNETAQTLYAATGWKRDEQFYMYHFVIGR